MIFCRRVELLESWVCLGRKYSDCGVHGWEVVGGDVWNFTTSDWDQTVKGLFQKHWDLS